MGRAVIGQMPSAPASAGWLVTWEQVRKTTMGKEAPEPLRGDAAWKAAKQRVADNNEAAYARGRAERAARSARAQDQRRAADRKDRARLSREP
jgi:hypothetical protein